MRPNQEPQKTPQQASPRPPRFRMNWWWVVFVVGLLAVNFYASSRATQAQSRVRVPYSPFFLNEVRAGDVKDIT